MPKLLILVQPARRTVVPVRDPAQWEGQVCDTCGRRIEHDPAIFVVAGPLMTGSELRCSLHVDAPPQEDGCVWCGRPDSPVRDTGHRFCQPHWAMYVAWVSDVVERPEWGDLMAAAKEATGGGGERDDPQAGEDQADRGGGP